MKKKLRKLIKKIVYEIYLYDFVCGKPARIIADWLWPENHIKENRLASLTSNARRLGYQPRKKGSSKLNPPAGGSNVQKPPSA